MRLIRILLLLLITVWIPWKTDASIIAWGTNYWGQTTIPATVPPDIVEITGGVGHTLARTASGTVVAWGLNFAGQATVPSGLDRVVAIHAAASYSLALQDDGKVTRWGYLNESSAPTNLGPITQLAVSPNHIVALQEDGIVRCWGDNRFGQTDVPATVGNVRSVVAGQNVSGVIRVDGSLLLWGYSMYGQLEVPSGEGPFLSASIGSDHVLALREDGTVKAWGSNDVGQTNVPSGLNDVVAVKAISGFSVAQKRDGTLVTWGQKWADKPIPETLGSVAGFGVGSDFAFALMHADWPSVQWIGPAQARAAAGVPWAWQVRTEPPATMFSFKGLPHGLTGNSTTGLITGTPAIGGTFPVEIEAQTSLGNSSSSLTITVDVFPTIRTLVPTSFFDREKPPPCMSKSLAPDLRPTSGKKMASPVTGGTDGKLDFGIFLENETGHYSVTATINEISKQIGPVPVWIKSNLLDAYALWDSVPAGPSVIREIKYFVNPTPLIATERHYTLALYSNGLAGWWTNNPLSEPEENGRSLPRMATIFSDRYRTLVGGNGAADTDGHRVRFDFSNGTVTRVPEVENTSPIVAELDNRILREDGSCESLVGTSAAAMPSWERHGVRRLLQGGVVRHDGSVIMRDRQVQLPLDRAGPIEDAVANQSSSPSLIALRPDGSVLSSNPNFRTSDLPFQELLPRGGGVAAGGFSMSILRPTGDLYPPESNHFALYPINISDSLATLRRLTLLPNRRTNLAERRGADGPPFLILPETATGAVSQPFLLRPMQAYGPLTFTASGLPSGVSCDPATGLISGICLTGGIHQITVRAENSFGSAEQHLRAVIDDWFVGTPKISRGNEEFG